MPRRPANSPPDPWLLPKNKIYYLRVRVPADLRGIIPGKEIRISLRTRDRHLAVRRMAAEYESLMNRFAAKRARVVLSPRQCAAVAGLLYRAKLAAFRDDAGDPATRREEARFWSERRAALAARGQGAEDLAREVLAGRFAKAALLEAERRGVSPGDTDPAVLATAFSLGEALACEDLARNGEGDYSDRAPDPFPPEADVLPSHRTRFNSVFEEYEEERRLKSATVRRWSPVFASLASFAQTEDMACITPGIVVAWKNHLLASGLNTRTVKMVHLAALKTLFSFVKAQGYVRSDPTARLTVTAARRLQSREKGLTLAEATLILRATFEPPPARLTPELAAARRWVPWLCAFTGARVSEITQLLPSNIQRFGKTVLIRITYEDVADGQLEETGTVKAGGFRQIALHPQVLEQGFLDFVDSRGSDPLFYYPKAVRQGQRRHPASRIGDELCTWIRSIGVDDPRVSPNHGWRHRFESLALQVKMNPKVLDRITGHGANRVNYGNAWPSVLRREIGKLPRYDLGVCPTLPASQVAEPAPGSELPTLSATV